MDWTPKADFKAKKEIASRWHDISASDVFKEAANSALLQLRANMTEINNDTVAAAANEWRMQGATMLIATMLNLTSEEKKRERKPVGNLDHTA